jgi:uncharacterized OB-fold protein
VTIAWLSTYQPAWESKSRRVMGPDEDLVTLAVDAASPGMRGFGGDSIARIIVVTEQPDVINTAAYGVLRRSLGIPDPVAVEFRVGGAPAALDALASSPTGTLVIGVENGTRGAAAGAALVADRGMAVDHLGRVDRSLPMRVHALGSPRPRLYDDARLERERGWRRAIEDLADGTDPVVIAGITAKEAPKLLKQAVGTDDAVGAASPFFALARMAAESGSGRLVALDEASGQAASVKGGTPAMIRTQRRAAVPAELAPRFADDGTEIPVALPAYERAFDAKVGFVAARCECGELNYPPRSLCLSCGASGRSTPEALPREGTVYTVVTVHIKVPAMATPYARAVVDVDGTPLRVLAAVTDVPPLTCAIGDRGRFVLRRVATREGVPDYGYSFQPTEREAVTA